MNFDYSSTTEVGGKSMSLDGSNIGYHKERVLAWERGRNKSRNLRRVDSTHHGK